MGKETKYSCRTCANRKTPLCELCTRIQYTDGTESKPKYYITLDEEVLEGFFKYRGARGAAETTRFLKYCIERGFPLPVGTVMAYNARVEREREK